MVERRIRSVVPLYAAGAVWIICGLIIPLYTLWGILLTAVLSAAVYLICGKLFPGQVELVPEKEKPIDTGDAKLNQALEAGRSDVNALKEIRGQLAESSGEKPAKGAASENIQGRTAVLAALERMIKAAEAIFAEISAKPDKAPMVRKFMEYYLPNVVKILTSYVKMNRVAGSGDNTKELSASVEKNAPMMAEAFEKQLDGLYLDEMLDITTDITVLEHMMKGDGLTDEAM